jgi:hypothetical protein
MRRSIVIAAAALAAGCLAACVPVRVRVSPALGGRILEAGRPAAGFPLALVATTDSTWREDSVGCGAVTARTRTGPDGAFQFPARTRWGVWVPLIYFDALFTWQLCAPTGADSARLVPVYAGHSLGWVPPADSVTCEAQAAAPAGRRWRCTSLVPRP